MPQHVKAPDGTVIEFPDTMGDDAITAAMGKLYPSTGNPGKWAQDQDFLSASPDDQIKYVSSFDPDFAKASRSDQLGYLSHVTGKPVSSSVQSAIGSVPNPIGPRLTKDTNGQLTGGQSPLIANAPPDQSQGFASSLASAAGVPERISDYYEGPKRMVMHPLDSLKLLAKSYSDTSNSEFNQTKDALAAHDYTRALAHGIGYAVPFVGPTVAKSMEQSGAENYPGAAGTLTGLIGPALIQGGIEEAIEPKTAITPSTTETLALRQALRPSDKDLLFNQRVSDAWPRIQEQVAENGTPKTLPEFDDLLKNAKKQVWAESSDLLNQAQSSRPPVKGLLPSAPGEIETAVPGVRGTQPGGVYPAESYPTERFNQSEMEPGETLSPLTPGYKSGGAHPELSGELTNPGVLSTRDTAALTATRDRLNSVISDQSHFETLSPGEQSAYLAQADRLNRLLEPGPEMPHGPTISGDVIADAIQQSIRPRNRFLQSSAYNELQDRANAYRGRQIPLTDAEDFLQDANTEAKGWYSQATRDPHGPQLGASAAAEATAIRSQLYKAIDSLTESDPGTAARLKREYGALDALHDYTAKRIPVVARQAPLNLAQQLSLGAAPIAFLHDAHSAMAAPVPFLAATAARKLNSPEFLVRRAVSPPLEIPPLLRRGIKVGGRAGVAGTAVASQPSSLADNR